MAAAARGMIDSFGFVDVTIDDWEDSLHYNTDLESISGCTTNSLLRGLFWLHSDVQEEYLVQYLPGHLTAWKKTDSYIFPCITSLLTPDCLLGRVCFAVRRHVFSLGLGGTEKVPAHLDGEVQDEESSHSFALGALLFTRRLVKEESVFIGDAHVRKLVSVAPTMLGALGDEIADLCQKDYGKANKQTELSNLVDIINEILSVIKIVSRLRARERHIDTTSGVGWADVPYPVRIPALPSRVRLSTRSDSESDCSIIEKNDEKEGDVNKNNSKSTARPATREEPIAVFGVTTDVWDALEHNQGRDQLPLETRLQEEANTPVPRASMKKSVSFGGNLAEPSLKKPSAGSNTTPIAVFGVSADLWDDIQTGNVPEIFEDDYHSKSSSNSARTESRLQTPSKTIHLPTPRISLGIVYDVVKSNSGCGAGRNSAVSLSEYESCDSSYRSAQLLLGDLDVLEVARQWTLADAALFRAIPMSSYQICELVCKNQHLEQSDPSRPSVTSHTTGTAAWTLPRSSGRAPQLRAFIDRFNAQSSWASAEVLRGDSARQRAAVYEKMVQLSTCLLELNNFNGCMAIMSGLLQGSVTRLEETHSLVSPEIKEKVTDLKKLMSGSKNYSAYRTEVNRRELHISAIDKFIKDFDFAFDPTADGMCMKPKKVILHNTGGEVNYDEVADAVEFGCTGIVPHLGPVLSELVLAQEGSSVYLLDYPHLLNLDRLMVYGQTLARLQDISKLDFWPLTPISPLMTAVNMALSEETLLIAHEAADRSRNLYNLSLERESGEQPHPIDTIGMKEEVHVADSPESNFSPLASPSNYNMSCMIPTEKSSADNTPMVAPEMQPAVSPATPLSPTSTPGKRSKWFVPASLFGSPFSRKGDTESRKKSLSPVSPAKQGGNIYFNTTDQEAALRRAEILKSDADITDITARGHIGSVVLFNTETDPFQLDTREMRGAVHNNGGHRAGYKYGGLRSDSRLQVYENTDVLPTAATTELSCETSATSPVKTFPLVPVSSLQLHKFPSRSYLDDENDDCGVNIAPVQRLEDTPTPPAQPQRLNSKGDTADTSTAHVDEAERSKSPTFRSMHSKNFSDWLAKVEEEDDGDDESNITSSPRLVTEEERLAGSVQWRDQKHLPGGKSDFSMPPAKQQFSAQFLRGAPPANIHSMSGSPPPFVFPKAAYSSNYTRDLKLRNGTRMLSEYENYGREPQKPQVGSLGIRLLPPHIIRDDRSPSRSTVPIKNPETSPVHRARSEWQKSRSERNIQQRENHLSQADINTVAIKNILVEKQMRTTEKKYTSVNRDSSPQTSSPELHPRVVIDEPPDQQISRKKNHRELYDVL